MQVHNGPVCTTLKITLGEIVFMCQPATHYITLPLPSHSLLLQKRDTVVYVGVVYDPYFLISDLHPIVICVHFRKENDELFPKAGYNVCVRHSGQQVIGHAMPSCLQHYNFLSLVVMHTAASPPFNKSKACNSKLWRMHEAH